MGSKKAILGVLLITLAAQAQAADWYFDLAFAHGGDKLADVELIYDDGDRERTKISAGGGISLAAGGVFSLSESLQLQTTIGYKEDGVHADNGSVAFKRMPLDVALFYSGDNWRFGAGGSYETHIALQGVYGPRFNFDGTLGGIIEIDYKFTDFVMMGLRYTRMQYEVDVGGWDYNERFEINGNNTSLRVAFMF